MPKLKSHKQIPEFVSGIKDNVGFEKQYVTMKRIK